jgi:4-amino-4-deoxy-L-arabinose transferase-like glycosyltransferase
MRILDIPIPASHLQWLRLARWMFVGWVILAFWQLGGPALMDPDEAHYAQLTREMLQAGNWLVPLLDGRPYIDKPVLFHWMQGVAIQLLGETELAMRLPSAIAALALFWTTRWAGRQLFGERVGDRGALMFATMPLTFALASVGLFDMVFTTFLFGGVACLLVAALRQRPRVQYVGYGLVTLAVMTKGPVALLLVGVFFVAGLACGRDCRAALLSLHWKRGLCFVVVASLPWFVWMWFTFGGHFLQQYLLAGNLYYVTQPVSFSARAPNHALYLSTFFAGFFPWSIILVGGGIDTVRRWWGVSARVAFQARKPEEVLLWAWMAVIFVFFTVARFKVDRYVYPAAPACCLLAAQTWLSASIGRPATEAAQSNGGARWSIGLLGVALVVMGIVAAFTIFDLGLELPRVAALIPISLTAGGAALTITMFRRHQVSPKLFAGLVVMLLVVYASAITFGAPLLDETRPTAEVARSLQSVLSETDEVGIYRLEKWRSSLRYYMMRPVAKLEHPADVERFLERARRGYVLMLDEDYKQLRQSGVRLRAIRERRAVTGTTGKGLRRQKWGSLVVATTDDRIHGQSR